MTATTAASPFTQTNTLAIIAIGVVAGCVTAVQPLLLGGLLEQGRLDNAQLGQAAMAEALGMAVSMTFAALMLRPERLQPQALGAVILAVLANAGTAVASGIGVILLRSVCGLCAGMLLWILVGFMARAPHPGRLFAIYVTAQAGMSFLLSVLLSNWLFPTWGAAGGFALLTLMYLGLLAAVAAIPARYASTGDGGARGRPPVVGVLALLGIALFLAGIMAFWVYVIPLGRQLGHAAGALNAAVSAAIGVQIAGGLAAAFLATRVAPLTVCLGGAVTIALMITAFLSFDGSIALFAALGVFSFCWMFVPPFQMPLLIAVDPTLRSVMLIGSAQLFGVAAGPLLSSQAVSDTDVSPAATVALACTLLAFLLLVGTSRLHAASAARD